MTIMTRLTSAELIRGLAPDELPSAELYSISGQAHEPEPLHYPQCGLDNVYLLNGFRLEVIDGEEALTIDDMDGLWKAIGLHLVCRRKVLSPKELKFLRRHMDLTQMGLAQYLRVTDQAVARWEKGETRLPGPADVAIRQAFLSAPVAQPEGMRIARHFRKMMKELVGTDEIPALTIAFRHGPDRWLEEEPDRRAA
jgi:DNA-binding transcriptional regulator YiaG